MGNEKINFTDKNFELSIMTELMQKQIINWSEGNRGAFTLLLNFATNPLHFWMWYKIESLTWLRGAKIYILWNDLADRDFAKMQKLLENCPTDILAEACSKTDFSGKELVKPYYEN